jgi:hypothetical protein
MDSSGGPNNGDSLDVFDNPLRQTPSVHSQEPVFEREESMPPGQDGTAAQPTKILRVKPEARNQTEEHQPQKDEKLRPQQKKKGPGRLARLGGGMKRHLLRSVTHLHADTSHVHPRKLDAELMWKRIFAMLDFKNDHSLTTAELREGLEVVRSRWAELRELYPCGEVEFAEHLILGGSQDDPGQDPTTLMATLSAEGECEHFTLGFCRIVPGC